MFSNSQPSGLHFVYLTVVAEEIHGINASANFHRLIILSIFCGYLNLCANFLDFYFEVRDCRSIDKHISTKETKTVEYTYNHVFA